MNGNLTPHPLGQSENRLVVPTKAGHTLQLSNPIPQCIPNRNTNIQAPKTSMRIFTGTPFRKNPNTETFQKPRYRRTDKDTAVGTDDSHMAPRRGPHHRTAQPHLTKNGAHVTPRLGTLEKYKPAWNRNIGGCQVWEQIGWSARSTGAEGGDGFSGVHTCQHSQNCKL